MSGTATVRSRVAKKLPLARRVIVRRPSPVHPAGRLLHEATTSGAKMPMTPVAIPDVEVLADTGLGYRVRVQGRELFVGRLQLPPGRLPPPVGSRGTLVVFRSAAWDLGLLPKPDL